MGERSYPKNKAGMGRMGLDKPGIGVYIHNEGPLHLQNVAFKNFKNDDIQRACGIEFQDNYQFGMGPTSSVKGEIDVSSQILLWKVYI